MASLPDLVRDNKLETSFEDKFTIHYYDDSDGEEHRRSSPHSEYWEDAEPLARGGCGEVLLQRCVQGKRTQEFRAVKRIARSISLHGLKKFDSLSELETIAKFSHRRVSSNCPNTWRARSYHGTDTLSPLSCTIVFQVLR